MPEKFSPQDVDDPNIIFPNFLTYFRVVSFPASWNLVGFLEIRDDEASFSLYLRAKKKSLASYSDFELILGALETGRETFALKIEISNKLFESEISFRRCDTSALLPRLVYIFFIKYNLASPCLLVRVCYTTYCMLLEEKCFSSLYV